MAGAVRVTAPRVATVAGVPVRVHLSFAVLLIFLCWFAGRAGGVSAVITELVFVTLVLLCVVAHELAHAIAARFHGVPVKNVTLYPFGGLATFSDRLPGGLAESRIAVAGPLANLVLAGLFLLVARGQPTITSLPGSAMGGLPSSLFWANVTLGLLNLAPVLPLDGGRALRGVLARRLGDQRATRILGAAGQVAGILLLVWGFVVDPWFGLLGFLVLVGATGELQRIQPLALLAGHRVRDVMHREILIVAPEAPLSALMERSAAAPISDLIVVDAGTPLGYIPAAKLWRPGGFGNAERTVAKDIILPLGSPITATATLQEARVAFAGNPKTPLPVVDSGGAPVGLLTSTRLSRSQALLDALQRRRDPTRGQSTSDTG